MSFTIHLTSRILQRPVASGPIPTCKVKLSFMLIFWNHTTPVYRGVAVLLLAQSNPRADHPHQGLICPWS